MEGEGSTAAADLGTAVARAVNEDIGRLIPGGEGTGGESGTAGKASNMSKSGDGFVPVVSDEDVVEIDTQEEGRALTTVVSSDGGAKSEVDLSLARVLIVRPGIGMCSSFGVGVAWRDLDRRGAFGRLEGTAVGGMT